MWPRLGPVIDRLRQPAYTGANRCLPCTVLNGCLAVVGAAVAAAAARPYGPAVAAAVGGGMLLVAAGAIALRGYLVPGTPRLTKTYLPEWLLRRFDAHDAATPAPTDAVDVEAFLQEAGAVIECEHADDLCLDDAFATAWQDRIAAINDDTARRAALATILDVDPDQLSVEHHGTAFVTRHEGRRVGQWESEAAFLADVAAAGVFHDRAADWPALDERARSRVLNGLRVFLKACPTCGGPVAIKEDVIESCCRSIDVFAMTCRDCDARVFEAEQPT